MKKILATLLFASCLVGCSKKETEAVVVEDTITTIDVNIEQDIDACNPSANSDVYDFDSYSIFYHFNDPDFVKFPFGIIHLPIPEGMSNEEAFLLRKGTENFAVPKLKEMLQDMIDNKEKYISYAEDNEIPDVEGAYNITISYMEDLIEEHVIPESTSANEWTWVHLFFNGEDNVLIMHDVLGKLDETLKMQIRIAETGEITEFFFTKDDVVYNPKTFAEYEEMLSSLGLL